jgi:hypothetical protein
MADRVFIEYTSKQLAKIAGKGLRDPQSLSWFEIRALAGCALTQARNKGVTLICPPRGRKNWAAEAV